MQRNPKNASQHASNWRVPILDSVIELLPFACSGSFNGVLRTPKHYVKSLNLWEIVIGQSNSRTAIRITIHRPSYRMAHRSPFASFRTDNGEIYLMDLNGRIRRRVTFTTDFNDSSPTFLTTPNYLFYSSEPKASREVKVVIQSSGSTPIYAGFNLTHIHSKITRACATGKFRCARAADIACRGSGRL